MSLLLGSAGSALPSGDVFPGVSTSPVGLAAGILLANGSLVSLATYPTLTYLNGNVGSLAGPSFGSKLDTLATNFATGDPIGYAQDSYVIGANHFLCGRNTSTNFPSIAYSTDLVNWTVKAITAVAGQWCFGIVKVGSTYYAGIAGVTAGNDFIYTSTDLTTWTLANTYAGGATIYGPSALLATGTTVVVMQGGYVQAVIYNGSAWSSDTNTILKSGNTVSVGLLSNGEIAAINIGGTVSPWTINVFKLAAGASAFTPQVVTAAFTGSVLAPSLANTSSEANGIQNGMNTKITYCGGNYVINVFGVVFTSSNFTSWTNQGDKKFVAMENIGGTLYGIALESGVQKYYSSTNGVTWTLYYTAPLDQTLGAVNFGARIIPISASLWAVCAGAEVSSSATKRIYFIYNPTTTPIVMTSSITNATLISPLSYSVNAAGTGILAGPYSLIPAYDPTASTLLPNLTSTAGAGTSMFMKI